MEIPDWRFQAEFEKLFLRAQLYGIRQQDVMTDELPLIWWEGSTEAVALLGDPQKQPPDDIENPGRVRPNEEFLCWLMLPKDYSGEAWYFGRVFSTRKSLPDELRMFRDMAAEAGSLLMQDSLFREYLAPCVKHIELVDRFPQFRKNLDISYWCALLFARPEGKSPIKFPYKELKDGGEVIGEASIVNPFKSFADVIVRWQLNSSAPMPATGRVAQPYQWPIRKPATSASSDDSASVVAETLREQSNTPPAALLDELTPNQVKIVRYLWPMLHGVDWDSLPDDAFRGGENRDDVAVKRQLERIQKRLNELYERFHVALEIKAEARRVKLEKISRTSENK